MVASGPASTCCPQVQDVVKCQMGVCRADESEDSPDSCKNGQLQILVSEEAWAGHRWVLSAPCPRPLTFPLPSSLSPSFWGLRSGLILVQPLTVEWPWASPHFRHLPVSGGAGGDHTGGPSALLGSVPWADPLAG